MKIAPTVDEASGAKITERCVFRVDESYRSNGESARDSAYTRRAAAQYIRAGLAVIPVPAGEKNPNRLGWQKERHPVGDIDKLWNNGQGIGVLWGEPSG